MPNPLALALAPKLFEVGSQLIDRLFPDKVGQEKERATAHLELTRLMQEGRLQELTVSMSAILAEASSADPWTSRARPSFMYVMYVMILFAIPMGFVAAYKPDLATGIANGMKQWLNAIPDSLYALFGAGYLGYTATRSWEKKRGLTK
jgi:hypothetical protein